MFLAPRSEEVRRDHNRTVNDPTTAVQALNQIEDLLLRLGRRNLEIGEFRDSEVNCGWWFRIPRGKISCGWRLMRSAIAARVVCR